MLRNMFAVILFIFSMNAFAGCETIPSENLSADTYKKMQELCTKDTFSKKTVVDTVSDNISLAANLGSVAKDFSSALGVAAKELGIAVNEFLNTPAGMLTAAVIIWKVFIIQILGLCMVFCVFVIDFILIRQILTETSEPVVVTYFWGMFQRVKTKKTYSNFADLNDNRGGSLVIIAFLSILAIWIIIAQLVV